MQKQKPQTLFLSIAFLALAAIPLNAQSANENNEEATKYPTLEIKNVWPDDITIEMPPPVFEIREAYMPLWIESLKHDEDDLRQEVISDLQAVHRSGREQSQAVPEIRKLISKDNHHTLNMAVASFLVELDDRESAQQLFELLKPGHIELAQIIEPALAKWNFEPIKNTWRERLADTTTRRTHLLLAIKCLAEAKDTSSVDALSAIAMDWAQTPANRLAAAKATGQISNGHSDRAKILASKGGRHKIVNQLCAIRLLSKDDSKPAISLLQQLMADEEGAVAGAAWQRILEIDSNFAVELAAKCMRHNDPKVRSFVVTSLLEQPNLKRMKLLGQLMSDRHPDVRIAARKALVDLANQSNEFDEYAKSVGMKAVAGTRYEGLEQSLTLLASLGHKPVADRAVQLLSHDHPKVLVASAFALRVLEVEKTYPLLLKHAQKVSRILLGRNRSAKLELAKANLDQIAHIFDLFGNAQYEPAEGLMRKFVPKNLELMFNCRPAAVTALGKLHAGTPDSSLVKMLLRRMNDQVSDPPEIQPVCATAAVALARMKAMKALPDLKALHEGLPVVSGFDYACAWAIRELSGEEFLPPEAVILRETGFSLEPTGARVREYQNPVPKSDFDVDNGR